MENRGGDISSKVHKVILRHFQIVNNALCGRPLSGSLTATNFEAGKSAESFGGPIVRNSESGTCRTHGQAQDEDNGARSWIEIAAITIMQFFNGRWKLQRIRLTTIRR
jgi:hypothetical protein